MRVEIFRCRASDQAPAPTGGWCAQLLIGRLMARDADWYAPGQTNRRGGAGESTHVAYVETFSAAPIRTWSTAFIKPMCPPGSDPELQVRG